MNIIRKAKTVADKRSIDAYGRSIELAIAGYLMDTGTFPTSIDQLTIEYSGDEVVCSTTQLKSDSSIYLAGCTVDGRSVEGYTYGKEEIITYDAYSVGDEVTYNNVDYYVIADSGTNEANVTLLKSEPLSYPEVQTYSSGTGAEVFNDNDCESSNNGIIGYGGMRYHTSNNVYSTSDVKATVDAWKIENAPDALEARLITLNELVDNLGYIFEESDTGGQYISSVNTPCWVYNSNYDYWTMSSDEDSISKVKFVIQFGYVYSGGLVFATPGKVARSVIVLPKSALN